MHSQWLGEGWTFMAGYRQTIRHIDRHKSGWTWTPDMIHQSCFTSQDVEECHKCCSLQVRRPERLTRTNCWCDWVRLTILLWREHSLSVEPAVKCIILLTIFIYITPHTSPILGLSSYYQQTSGGLITQTKCAEFSPNIWHQLSFKYEACHGNF